MRKMGLDKDVLVSVIVPVYNAEMTVERCVNSIQMQTYKNLEIILVDDGSEDNSLMQCKKLEETDMRIHVFHQENQGVSVARNVGIKLCTGEYLIFVDSDDAIEINMIKTMVDAVEDGYVVICDLQRITTGEVPLFCDKKVKKRKVGKDVFWDLYKKNLINSPVNKLYEKRKLVDGGKVQQFPVGLSLGEDLVFNLSYLKRQYGYIYINVPFYYYYDNGKDSLSNKYYDDELDIQTMLYTKLLEYCETEMRFSKKQYAEYWWRYFKALQKVVDKEYERSHNKISEKVKVLLNSTVFQDVLKKVKKYKEEYKFIYKVEIDLFDYGFYVVDYKLRKIKLNMKRLLYKVLYHCM